MSTYFQAAFLYNHIQLTARDSVLIYIIIVRLQTSFRFMTLL